MLIVAVNNVSPATNSEIDTVTKGSHCEGSVAGPKHKSHASRSEDIQQSPAISVAPSPSQTPKQS